MIVKIVPSNGEYEVLVDGEVYQLCHSHAEAVTLRVALLSDELSLEPLSWSLSQ